MRTNADGKVTDRKHWRLISADLRDKYGVRVSPASLKLHAAAIKQRSTKDFSGFDEKSIRKSISEAYPDLKVRFAVVCVFED
ncbi:MAG: hypothetical protein ACYCOU_25905 [Sulfobacillus sp.]